MATFLLLCTLEWAKDGDERFGLLVPEEYFHLYLFLVRSLSTVLHNPCCRPDSAFETAIY